MKFRPLLVMVLALNAVFVSGGVGLLGRETASGRRLGARAEAAAVVAVSGVAKGAVRLLIWSVKTGSFQ